MADFQILNGAIAQTSADIDALIAKGGSEDPTIQQNINSAADAVAQIDAKVKTALGTPAA